MSLASTSVSAPSSCGPSHAKMGMQTIAMDDADFQNWIDEQMVPQSAAGEPRRPVHVAPAFLANRSCHLVEGLMAMRTSPPCGLAGRAEPHPLRQPPTLPAASSTPTPRMARNCDDIRSGWSPEVVKENYANGLPDGELPRGMPNLGLSERMISDLVAYLETLGQKPSAEILAATEVERAGDHRNPCPHQW